MEKGKIDSFYDKYSKKQLYELYMDAMCDEISDSRFYRISAALHETVHLGQFSKDSFGDLLDSLFDLSDEALKDIERGNFARFYKTYLKYSQGMPEDFYYMSIFIDALYTDYANVTESNNYQYLCNYCMLFIRDIARFKDNEMMQAITRANSNLGQLLLTHFGSVNYGVVKEKKYTIAQMRAYTAIECHLLVSFLMGVEDFSYDYSLPTKLLNEMAENIKPDVIKKVGDYMKFDEGGSVLAKQLLHRQYLQENIIYDINSLTDNKKLEKKIKISNSKI